MAFDPTVELNSCNDLAKGVLTKRHDPMTAYRLLLIHIRFSKKGADFPIDMQYDTTIKN
jgi:hypothetical protein